MDRSVVKRLAIQTGFQPDSAVFLPMLHSFAEKVIENFLSETGQYVTNDASREAALEQARAAEREACAKVCEGPRGGVTQSREWWDGFNSATRQCAEMIRARRQK